MGHHRLFTYQEFIDRGGTASELRWGVSKGQYRRIRRRVYAAGSRPPSPFELELAKSMAGGAPARGFVAAKLLGLDGVRFPHEELPRTRTGLILPDTIEVDRVTCVGGLQTMFDLASLVDPIVWEQANESALHKGLFHIEQMEALLPELSRRRLAGAPLIRHVLGLRPPGAPPTESLLETLMVQLARATPGVPEPTRQLVVRNEHDEFVARVDLSWPDEGGFNELDGEHHKGQPVHDANRQTEVTIVTGWLCGRFSWTEVRHNPVPTARRLQRFIATANSRRTWI